MSPGTRVIAPDDFDEGSLKRGVVIRSYCEDGLTWDLVRFDGPLGRDANIWTERVRLEEDADELDT